MKYKIFLFFLCLHSQVWAAPETTNFQAHIAKPDGTDLESDAVTFTFKYKNEAGNCTLYVETYLGVDMSGSAGDVSIQLGSGAPAFPVAGVALKDILNNAPTNTMNCIEGGNYTPTLPTEKRKFVVEFSYAGSSGTQSLAATDINAVPYSMYAGDAENLGGFAAALYAKFSDVTTCAGGQFLTFNGTVFSCAAPGTPVNFSGNLSGDVTGTQNATILSKIQGKAISVAAPASGEFLGFDGTTWVPMAVAGAAGGTVTSVTSANLYLSVASSSTTPVLTVNVGQAANTVAAGDDARITGAWQSASALSGDVTGTLVNNTVSAVGGKSAAQVNTSVNDTLAATATNTPSTIVKRDASGDVTFSSASATNLSARNFLFYDSGVNKITVKSPAVLSADYTLTLPDDGGTNGYVLSTNGAGVTSWIPAATGSVTNVTATAPVQSSGGATPNISLAKATAGADGYLASTDWTIFNNKQNTLAAANAATDGYLTSSDWTAFNSKQAAMVRATAGADGYLASTDWTTFNNKQNTLSTANAATDGYLTSSDWTTFNSKQATLAQASSITNGYLASTDFSLFSNKISSQWTTSSSDIYYNSTGKVGIGKTPSYALDVSGDINLTGGSFRVNGSAIGASGVTSVTASLPLSATAGLTPNITIATASSTTTGALSSADFSSFSNKVSSQWSTSSDTTSVYYNGGRVGLGTSAPRATLDITGSVAHKAATSDATATIDFGVGNLHYTAQNCQTYALHNMKDGGSYMFYVQGTVSALCAFNAFSDAGVTALTVKLPPDHGSTTPLKQTVYNFVVMGTNVIVTWVPGY